MRGMSKGIMLSTNPTLKARRISKFANPMSLTIPKMAGRESEVMMVAKAISAATSDVIIVSLISSEKAPITTPANMLVASFNISEESLKTYMLTYMDDMKSPVTIDTPRIFKSFEYLASIPGVLVML